MHLKKVTLAVSAAAIALALAACGSSTSDGSTATSATTESASTSMDDSASMGTDAMDTMDGKDDMDTMEDMNGMDDMDGMDGMDDMDGHDHEGHDMDSHKANTALSAEQDGYAIALMSESAPKGEAVPVEFTIFGPDGEPVTKFDTVHEEKMHVLVVSDDLTEYHHVHPKMSKDGMWSETLPLASDRTYKVVADFVPTGGDNIAVSKTFIVGAGSNNMPMLTENRVFEVDGYRAELVGDTAHEDSAPLKLLLTQGGNPVTDVTPYLGAAAHFVAFSDADGAYYHMHPNSSTISEKGEITFTAPPMDHANYKGFIQVDVGGSVKTFEFVWRGE